MGYTSRQSPQDATPPVAHRQDAVALVVNSPGGPTPGAVTGTLPLPTRSVVGGQKSRAGNYSISATTNADEGMPSTKDVSTQDSQEKLVRKPAFTEEEELEARIASRTEELEGLQKRQRPYHGGELELNDEESFELTVRIAKLEDDVQSLNMDLILLDD